MDFIVSFSLFGKFDNFEDWDAAEEKIEEQMKEEMRETRRWHWRNWIIKLATCSGVFHLYPELAGLAQAAPGGQKDGWILKKLSPIFWMKFMFLFRIFFPEFVVDLIL